ncbi:MAG: zf-HC2 domain-containing protein [Chloracidobacterium sp.]|nr:zf-HC2 domain-containing protein [Chloracidobacterium sp.]MDW8217404.1 zf-HC2 domain-containing protein [Acidobacteriota bacterium]
MFWISSILTRLLRRDARHVAHLLTAYVHHELAPRQAERVRRHLSQCPACAEAYNAVRAVAASAEAPVRRAAPNALWPAIAKQLTRADAAEQPVRRMVQWPAFAAVAVMFLVGGVWWWEHTADEQKPETLRVYPACGPQTTLELAARDLHRDWAAGTLRFEIETDQPPALTDWLRRTAGLDVPLTDLPPGVPAAVPARACPKGAKRVTVGDRRGVMVGYILDGAPVTLLVTPAAESPGVAQAAQMMNGFVYRADLQAQLTWLTWTRDGQTYALVSSLSVGAQSCLICHQRDERRRQIAKLGDLTTAETTFGEKRR